MGSPRKVGGDAPPRPRRPAASALNKTTGAEAESPAGEAPDARASAVAKLWEQRTAARRAGSGEQVRLGSDGALAFPPPLKNVPRDALLERIRSEAPAAPLPR